MKKIKLPPDIKPILDVIHNSEYSYVFKPSKNPTWLVVHEDIKKVVFEYGVGAYDCEEVDISFLNHNLTQCPHCNKYFKK